MARPGRKLGFSSVSAVMMWILVVTTLALQAGQAQIFTVLHTFSGGSDGGNPGPNLVMDRAGNLYGTASAATHNASEVFRLAKHGSAWIFTRLYLFSLMDGIGTTGLLVGRDGSLYGTNALGGAGGSCGGGGGCGTLFKLTPPANICPGADCPWTLTVLYRFTGHGDGGNPENLIADSAGNLYGTTFVGGNLNVCQSFGCGVVFKFTPSNGGWTESVLYSFNGSPSDGAAPAGQLLFDAAGNLYGTTDYGGSDQVGSAFEISPFGSGWTQTMLYSFLAHSGPAYPKAGFLLDGSGNLYSTTNIGGSSSWGTVYSLSSAGGSWMATIVHSFDGSYGDGCPFSGLSMDAGNLYGTSVGCNGEHGNVYRLSQSNGGWSYNSLYSFTGNNDGANPGGPVLVDASGKLYGTAPQGGTRNNNCSGLGCGVVWEITP